MLDADVVGKSLLELSDLGTEYVTPMIEDPLDTGVDLSLELAVLGMKVNELH
jgi:hypothetical protein